MNLSALLRLCESADIELIATIQGLSMSPGLPPDTRVRLRPVDRTALKQGDVVAFQRNGGLIAHRIVYVGRRSAGRGYLLTRGDAVALHDSPVSPDSIVGVVTARRIGDDWLPLEPPAAGGLRYRLSALITSLAGKVLEVSPGASARLTRAAQSGCALLGALRASLRKS